MCMYTLRLECGICLDRIYMFGNGELSAVNYSLIWEELGMQRRFLFERSSIWTILEILFKYHYGFFLPLK